MAEKRSTAIAYNPSLVARVARNVLPWLKRTLPPRWYKAVYDRLYAWYRASHRGRYLLTVIKARIGGNRHEVARASLVFSLLPYTMGGRRALENAFDVVALVEQKKIDGALVECGVAQGGTAAMMALASRAVGSITRQKWLFDSYEGLPDPTADDYQDGKVGEVVQPIGKGACLGTIEQVESLMFQKLRLPRDEVHLVKGWFQATLPVHRREVGPIAVLRLDGDWYESTKLPLEMLFGQVVPGGYVIIDDYATCFGSRKATDEFRAEQGITAPLRPDGRGGAWFEKDWTTSG